MSSGLPGPWVMQSNKCYQTVTESIVNSRNFSLCTAAVFSVHLASPSFILISYLSVSIFYKVSLLRPPLNSQSTHNSPFDEMPFKRPREYNTPLPPAKKRATGFLDRLTEPIKLAVSWSFQSASKRQRMEGHSFHERLWIEEPDVVESYFEEPDIEEPVFHTLGIKKQDVKNKDIQQPDIEKQHGKKASIAKPELPSAEAYEQSMQEFMQNLFRKSSHLFIQKVNGETPRRRLMPESYDEAVDEEFANEKSDQDPPEKLDLESTSTPIPQPVKDATQEFSLKYVEELVQGPLREFNQSVHKPFDAPAFELQICQVEEASAFQAPIPKPKLFSLEQSSSKAAKKENPPSVPNGTDRKKPSNSSQRPIPKIVITPPIPRIILTTPSGIVWEDVSKAPGWRRISRSGENRRWEWRWKSEGRKMLNPWWARRGTYVVLKRGKVLFQGPGMKWPTHKRRGAMR